MPQVHRLMAIDDRRRILLEAVSLGMPEDYDIHQLMATAERFGLGEIDDIALRTERACRGCGCTQERACPGGCSWVEPDLCSSCAGKGIIR